MTAGFGAQLHPADLIKRGPRVPVVVHPAIGNPKEQTPIRGEALLDTGASNTAINDKVAILLGYKPVNYIDAAHAGGVERKPVYPITFEFPGSNIQRFTNAPLAGLELDPQRLLMLIGRDILSHSQFIYHGPSGVYSITIPAPPIKPNTAIPSFSGKQVPKKGGAKKTRKKRNKSRGRKKR